MTIFAAGTIFLTFTEYLAHRKREKAEVLSVYNDRYTRDSYIKLVSKYIISKMDENEKAIHPSIHDVEMFMRFFEELEIQLTQKRIEEEHVFTLFAYYAIYVGSNMSLIRDDLKITDYSDDSWAWKPFRDYVERSIKYLLNGTTFISDDGKKKLSFGKGTIRINNNQYKYSYKTGVIIFDSNTIIFHIDDLLLEFNNVIYKPTKEFFARKIRIGNERIDK